MSEEVIKNLLEGVSTLNHRQWEMLKSEHVDIEKGVYLINGVDIRNESIMSLNLSFFNGLWQLDRKGVEKDGRTYFQKRN